MPTDVDLGDSWEELHPGLKGVDITAHQNEDLARQLSNGYVNEEDLRQMPYYFFRSFKTMTAITLYSNFRFILSSNPNFIDTFFKKLYCDVLSNKRVPLCNFDHIARIIALLLEKESFIVQSYMIRYNVPYFLLEYLNYPSVYDLLLGLFSPASPWVKIAPDIQRKFWEYAKETRILVDIARAIFSGEAFDERKKSESYHTLRLGDFSKMILSSHSDYSMDCYNLLYKQSQSVIIAEEQYAINKDIDLVYRSLKGRRASISSRMQEADATTVSQIERLQKENVESLAKSVLEVFEEKPMRHLERLSPQKIVKKDSAGYKNRRDLVHYVNQNETKNIEPFMYIRLRVEKMQQPGNNSQVSNSQSQNANFGGKDGNPKPGLLRREPRLTILR